MEVQANYGCLEAQLRLQFCSTSGHMSEVTFKTRLGCSDRILLLVLSTYWCVGITFILSFGKCLKMNCSEIYGLRNLKPCTFCNLSLSNSDKQTDFW